MDFPINGSMENPVLVLSGGNDDAGTAVEDLESRLKEANTTWQITRYSGIEHGFTNFGLPAYNEWVDHRSWAEMGTFLKERFGEIEYGTMEPVENMDYVVVDPEVGVEINLERSSQNASMVMSDDVSDSGAVTVRTIAYDDNGFALQGHLAMPPSVDNKVPAVVILPDWDGVNGPSGYEAKRAVLMAQEGGYVAMAADVYGVDYTDVEAFEKRVELATKYRSDPKLFVSRVKAAVDLLAAHPSVDASHIFVAGYCLGGTGAIDYAFSSGTFENVKAVVPVHGGLTPLRAIETEAVQPYVLVLSGGIDDAHGNSTELEQHLDGSAATWEISRYSNAAHGFTSWGTGPFSAYNEMADSRSWWSMMSLFNELSVSSDAAMDEEKATSGEMEPLDQGVSSSAVSGRSLFVLVSVAMASMVSSLLC